MLHSRGHTSTGVSAPYVVYNDTDAQHCCELSLYRLAHKEATVPSAVLRQDRRQGTWCSFCPQPLSCPYSGKLDQFWALSCLCTQVNSKSCTVSHGEHYSSRVPRKIGGKGQKSRIEVTGDKHGIDTPVTCHQKNPSRLPARRAAIKVEQKQAVVRLCGGRAPTEGRPRRKPHAGS
jgi:hypothetical protein